MGYNQYFSIEKLEKVRGMSRRDRWSAADDFVKTIIENRDYRLRVKPRIAYDEGNVNAEDFSVGDLNISDSQGTYTLQVQAMYTQPAPVLPPNKVIDIDNPLDKISIENVMVMFQCQYSVNNTLENVSAYVDVTIMGSEGTEIEIDGDSV